LALELHPDKNSAPGAEEAFKKISQAFNCLSDESKRATYDLTGTEEESSIFRRRRNPTPAAFDDDITPEEIFNMFFGGTSPLHRTGRARAGGGSSKIIDFFLFSFFLVDIDSVFSLQNVYFWTQWLWSLSNSTNERAP
jgi:DnaJ-class molecular chaperone